MRPERGQAEYPDNVRAAAFRILMRFVTQMPERWVPIVMHHFIVLFLSVFLLGCSPTPDGAKIATSPFLRPYVEQLKQDASGADLNRIKTMAKSELILLHHGYGTGIRNKWLHGN